MSYRHLAINRATAAPGRAMTLCTVNPAAMSVVLEWAAIGDLVAEGHHREVAYPLLQLRTAVQGILENDGDQEVRAWSRAEYGRLLVALGIQGDEAFDARGEALQAFVPDLRKGCEEILARNPVVLD